MQSTLVVLLLFCLVMAAVSYYLGFIRPPRVAAWQSQAAFLVFTFLLASLLAYVLFQQRGAVKRLEEYGFSAHPGIREAVGVGNGVGEEPRWLFKVEGEAEEVLDFIRNPDSRPGWELKTDGGTILIFERGGDRMTVTAGRSGDYTSLMLSCTRGTKKRPGQI